MTIQEAIKRAFENGYGGEGAKFNDFDKAWSSKVLYYEPDGYATNKEVTAMLLDPLFWQALGKSMGWETSHREYAEPLHELRQGEELSSIEVTDSDYLMHWHRLIDHLAEGRSVESFFAPL